MNLGKLSSCQKDQLLNFFFYQMSMEQRERLMKELPEAYNAACEREIVTVVRTSTNERV